MTISIVNKRTEFPAGLFCFLVILACCLPMEGRGAEWVRAGLTTNQPVWGIQGGLQFALHPFGFRTNRSGPRGLIRVGYPILENRGYNLINFIAVEPIVGDRKGFSELEHSKLDHTQGKRFWVGGGDSTTNLHPGKLTKLTGGVEQLEVDVHVETFENGADISLTLSQRSDAPDELQLTIHPGKNSAPMKYCILTATMGNFARTRQLWLKDKVASSLKLYPDYRGKDFAHHVHFPLDQMHRNATGDVLLGATTDERDPKSVSPFPGTKRWFYGGDTVTQYWKKPRGTYRDTLEGVVNARYTYWQSSQPIPGGISFENIELREPFYPGQTFVFGITRQTPAELGFKSRP